MLCIQLRAFLTYLVAILVTSIFLSSSVFAADFSAGELVKTPGNDAVYEVADDGSSRLVFQMQTVFESWYGTDFSTVKTISQEQLADLSLAGVKSFKPGSLVKSPSLEDVYRVSEPLKLELIPDEESFFAYGFSFADVKDIPDGFFTSYRIVGTYSPESEQTPPDSEPQDPQITPDTEPETPPVFEVLSRAFTADSTTTGVVDVETSLNSTVVLTYTPQGTTLTPKTQESFDAKTSHSFALSDLTPATKYDYTLTYTNTADSVIIEESGTFVSHYDLFVSSHGTAPTSGTLRTQNVEVGKFFMYNNTTDVRIVNELWFKFGTLNNATDKVSKTIKIVDQSPSSATFGETLAFKTIGNGTSIRNSLNLQKFKFLNLTIDPGAQGTYSIIISNLEGINADLLDGESFITSIEYVNTLGDTQLYIGDSIIGTKYHE